jgi:multiple antibiotic resistance protein
MAPTVLDDVFSEFVTLFVILDPVATSPIFLAVTAGLDRRKSLTVAFHAVGTAFLIPLDPWDRR